MSHLPGSSCFFLQREARSLFHEALRRCAMQHAPSQEQRDDLLAATLDRNGAASRLLSRVDLAQAARDAARPHGYFAVIDDATNSSPVADAAELLLHRFRDLRSKHGRTCLVSTGEIAPAIPAPLQGKAGGGRNQHFVLECAVRLQHSDGPMAVLSCSAGGFDGESSAAGAVIASDDLRDADLQSRAREALACFASNTLLQRIGALVETGPTGWSAHDLRLLLG
jgi:glycerate 2-kinase